MTKLYRVFWSIDVDAEDPVEAALMARDMQEPGTTALVFDVRDDAGKRTSVNLAQIYAGA